QDVVVRRLFGPRLHAEAYPRRAGSRRAHLLGAAAAHPKHARSCHRAHALDEAATRYRHPDHRTLPCHGPRCAHVFPLTSHPTWKATLTPPHPALAWRPLSAANGTRRRVVVTGLGLVTPLGTGTEPNWESLVAGRSGIGKITRFDASPLPARIAGEVRDFEPERFIERRDLKKMDIFIQYAVGAAELAVQDASLPLPLAAPERTGVIVGVGIGGIASVEEAYLNLTAQAGRRISPFLIPRIIPNMASGQIAMRYGLGIAEGAGVLVLEEVEHARRRGARVYAELIGYGATCDAYHMTQPAPEGVGAAECMSRCLDDAGIEPGAIGYINAHGTGTP